MIFSNFWGLVRDWFSFWLLYGIGYLWGAYGCCLDLAASIFIWLPVSSYTLGWQHLWYVIFCGCKLGFSLPMFCGVLLLLVL
jgi:hypothetical protein